MIEGLGVRNLIVQADVFEEGNYREVRQQSAGLTVADAMAVDETLPFIDAWAGVKNVDSWQVFSHEGQTRGMVKAVSPSYFDLSGLEATRGELFDEEDDRGFAQQAVLGSTAAKQLFPNGDAIGKRIKVNYVWLEVIGVLQDRQLPNEEFQGEQVGGESNHVYIPLRTGLHRMNTTAWASQLSELKVQVAASTTPAVAAKAIQHLVDRRHGGQRDTRIVIPARLLAQQRDTQQIFTIVMSAVAGISLLVGGIGIMNIMLASVLERRSEIGLLRAVGARQVDVIRQFLIETTVIALTGAGAGVVLGIGIAYVIATYSGWAVAWSLPVIALAVIVCIAIAVCFGVYPAMSAAKMDPVAALQTE